MLDIKHFTYVQYGVPFALTHLNIIFDVTKKGKFLSEKIMFVHGPIINKILCGVFCELIVASTNFGYWWSFPWLNQQSCQARPYVDDMECSVDGGWVYNTESQIMNDSVDNVCVECYAHCTLTDPTRWWPTPLCNYIWDLFDCYILSLFQLTKPQALH